MIPSLMEQSVKHYCENKRVWIVKARISNSLAIRKLMHKSSQGEMIYWFINCDYLEDKLKIVNITPLNRRC
jgi:hypothetical protein